MAWVPLAMAGASLLGGLFGGRGGNSQREDPRFGAFDAHIQRAGRRGNQAEEEYLRRIRSFDPMQAALQATQAQYAAAMPEIRRSIADLRGAQVGQGRINTGFGMNDQDLLLQQNLNNLNQGLIQRAMQATQMQMQNTGQLGQYGMNQSNLYLDATLGRAQSAQDRRAQEEASRRGMWGNLIGAGLGAFGSYAGARGW